MPTLNDRMLKSLRPPEVGKLELTDDKVAGLQFRLTAHGHAGWRVRVTVDGKRKWSTIGGYPEISLSDARKRAMKERVGLLEGKESSSERRKNVVAGQKALSTVDDVLGLYVALHLAQLKTGREREQQLRWALGKHLSKPVEELKRGDLQAAIDGKAAEGKLGAANRIRTALVAFCRWAWEREHLPENIGTGTKKVAKETPRERVLSLEEVRELWLATYRMGDLWGPLVRLLVLTAQRRGDVAGLRWSEIDLDARRWAIPASRTKNGRPHIVHLSDPALGELHAMRENKPRDMVFSTTGESPVSGFGKVKRRLDKLVGFDDWRLHDLRTAFASALCDAGEPEGIVDRCLNHSATGSAPSAVARVYNRSEMLPQRARVLDRWAAMVLSEEPAGNVVDMRRGG